MTKKKSGSAISRKKLKKPNTNYDTLNSIDSKIASYGYSGVSRIADIADRPKTWEYILLLIFIPLILVIIAGIIFLISDGFFKKQDKGKKEED